MSQKRCDATSVTPHYICKIFTRKKEIFTNFDLFPKSGILRFIGKTKVKFLYIITFTSTIRYPLLPKNEMRFRGSIFLSLSVLLNLSLAIPVFFIYSLSLYYESCKASGNSRYLLPHPCSRLSHDQHPYP